PDTAVFAAIMAEAARVYRDSDAAYADRLLTAARHAWAWLQDHPKPLIPTETEGTGGYAYSRDGSQRLWAAAELYKTTGEAIYWQPVSKYLDLHSPAIGTLGWSDPETYAVLSLAFSERTDPTLRADLTRTLTRWADGMVTSVDTPINPWRISISSFHWAS